MKLLAIILIILFAGALFIISNENIHMMDNAQNEKFFTLYYGWLYNLLLNSVKITTNVIQSQWLPGNQNTSVAK